MGKPLDERVKKILKELDFDHKECLWDCHGTWVMYHRFVEIAGAKAGIRYTYDEIETDSGKGVVCVKCKAGNKIDDDGSFIPEVVTYGEASPKNNKNPYPYAMAEKRSYDRAVLKILGLHGFIYSEDEMDLADPKIHVKKSDKGKVIHGKEEYDALDEEGKLHVNATAQSIKDLFLSGKPENKRKAYLEHVHGADNDFKMALWYVLQPQSEIRRALKDLSEVINKEQ